MAGWQRLASYVLAVSGALGCSYSEPWSEEDRGRIAEYIKFQEEYVRVPERVEKKGPLEKIAGESVPVEVKEFNIRYMRIESDDIKTPLGEVRIDLTPVYTDILQETINWINGKAERVSSLNVDRVGFGVNLEPYRSKWNFRIEVNAPIGGKATPIGGIWLKRNF